MAILIDSSVFCAYANTQDIHHKNAKKLIEEIVSGKYGGGIITDYIFDETVTVAMRRFDKKGAIEIGEFIINSEIFLARVDKLIFEEGWKIFLNTNRLSFTDCTSIAFMQIFGIEKIATFDKGFIGIKDIVIIS